MLLIVELVNDGPEVNRMLLFSIDQRVALDY